MSRVTIDDVAREAGVSIKTVSRVVNTEPNVKESTRQRVADAIEALNYRPNTSARSLASNRSYVIGLVYDDPSAYDIPSSGYVVNMQQGLLETCKSANLDLLIHPCNYRSREAGRELRKMIEHARPDGIVLAAPLSNMPGIVTAIEETGTPLIRISPGERNPIGRIVRTNDREASSQMTQYLLSLGHRDIAFVTGHPRHFAVQQRLAGFEEALQAAGISPTNERVIVGDNSIGSGEAAAEKLLGSDSLPTAVFAANDDMAAGVIRVLQRRGIRIPDDMSVAGFDDIALAAQIYPSLTTVHQPLVEMARTAAQMLLEGAAADSRVVMVPGRIVTRESTSNVRTNSR